MKISRIGTKTHPLQALWEGEQTQGLINGRTGRALLTYLANPMALPMVSNPERLQGSPLIPDFSLGRTRSSP